jgi:DNA primase
MNRSLIETIKERVSLVDVLSRYMKLTTSGTQMKGLCPFHGEKTPSFYVSPERGNWKCFGCGKGGDVISFVQDIEHISFREAAQNLAQSAGISIDDNALKPEASDETSSIYAYLTHTADSYNSFLQKNIPVLEYLKSRGVSSESIEKFHIGFAPDAWQNISISGKHTADVCVASGVSIQGTKGIYDRFRSRIMFPTKDIRDRVVTFSGRIWSQNGQYTTERDTSGKYINGPETLVYKKSKTLYGLSEARIKIAQKKRAIIVEGHLDCVMSHQVGYTETVALAGTALTVEHIDLLKRFCEQVILCLDADVAGQKAVAKSLTILYTAGFRVLVATLPPGSDPADSIRLNSLAYKDSIENAKEYVSARIQQMRANHMSVVESEKILKNEIYPIVAYQSNPIYRDDSIHELANYMNTSPEIIREHMQIYVQAARKQEEKVQEKTEEYIVTTTDRLLAIWTRIETDHISNSIVEYLESALQKKYVDYNDFFKQFAKPDQDYLLMYSAQYSDTDPTEALVLQIYLYCKEYLDYWKKSIVSHRSLSQERIEQAMKSIISCENYITSHPYAYKN